MKWLLAFSTLFFALPLAAAECENITYKDRRYTLCKINPEQQTLRLFLNDDTGVPLGSFRKVAAEHSDQTLVFAMNAGMYHAARNPVGYYVEAGLEYAPLITRPGPGNFGLLPNGVFCIRKGRADVYEARSFAKAGLKCTHATQSGPMLVINGALHPRFLVKSTSHYIRNGVGTADDGKTAIFAISNERVSFHEFGSLFRDHLKTPNALYFDGNISQLYAPEFGRADIGVKLGPIVGVLE